MLLNIFRRVQCSRAGTHLMPIFRAFSAASEPDSSDEELDDTIITVSERKKRKIYRFSRGSLI